MRFIALQDPTDNWMVYDLLFETPAGFSGGVLYGLSREEAEHLTNPANMKFGSTAVFGGSNLGHLALRSNIHPFATPRMSNQEVAVSMPPICESNEQMATIHDRMPVILAPSDYKRWLGPEPDPRDLMKPSPSELMTMPIDSKVGSPGEKQFSVRSSRNEAPGSAVKSHIGFKECPLDDERTVEFFDMTNC